MYDSLVGFDLEKGGVGPGVAERWVMSEDGLSWTFHLRAGQIFHNGDPLTAHDVKFSLERQMSPKSLAAAAGSMRRSIKSIDVVDDLTVRVNTNEPQIGLPAALSRAVAPEGSIMPKKYFETVGEEEFRKKPIGSGPWKFVRSVPGDRLEFEAVNNAHWRGRPRFKSLHILQIPEESTRVAMVRTGEAAIASISPETMLGAGRAGARGADRSRHDAGRVPVLRHVAPLREGRSDHQAAGAASLVARDRSAADHRACDGGQGADAAPVRDLRLHRKPERRPLEEVVRRGLPVRSRPRQENPGGGRISERLRAQVRQHGAARHAVHDQHRHRHRRHVDQDRRQGDHQALRVGCLPADADGGTAAT